MSEQFVGEIRMFGGNFAPQGWAYCDGQLLAISENPSLFQLIGTTYGGDGQQTFGLPNLCGRLPIHMGQGPGSGTNYVIGQTGGSETVTLTTLQMPSHNHSVQYHQGAGEAQSPANAVWADSTLNQFTVNPPDATMAPAAMSVAGESQPHENVMPFLAVNFIICLAGIFPSQS